MSQDRVIFEEKLKRGLVPDGEGGWITIDAAILKEKSRHRQSRLWDPKMVVATVEKPKAEEVEEKKENLFFEESKPEVDISEPVSTSDDDLDVDPIEDTTEVNLFEDDDDEDTAIHELEPKAPDTTIIETVTVSDDLLSTNETDTVALDRDEVMRDIQIIEEGESGLDGLAEDFGNIIDSFASSESEGLKEPEKDDFEEEVLIEDFEKKIEPVKINDSDIDLPPSSNDQDEIIFDLSEEKPNIEVKEKVADDDLDDWEKSNGSIWPKVFIFGALVISAAVLVTVILIFT